MLKSFLLIVLLQSCVRHVVLAVDDEKTTSKRTIVGGVEAEKGRYAYQVALVNGGGGIVCGGSLVAENWVLSAAHCANVARRVSIGSHDLSVEEDGREVIDIDCEISHPDYNRRTYDNDYMMVRLKESSTFPVVQLDDGSTTLEAGTNLTIMGWGTTSSGGSTSDILLEAETDYVTNDECNDAYDGEITDNMMCAARDGIDTCQGDSGGPIIVKGDDASVDVQVGVVSWGIGCANPDYPGVYALVSAKYDWVQEQMASETRAETWARKFRRFFE